MRTQVTELNNRVADVGDAISDTVSAIVPVSVEIINLPWLLIRGITEETSGAIDSVVG